MYFNKLFYNDKIEPSEVEIICEKCGKYLNIPYNTDTFNYINNDYCIVSNGYKIICECGNRCQNGIVEPKKVVKLEDTKVKIVSATQFQNTPRCPTCNSTNIKKISGLSKAGSVAMWGIFSRKIHKQWYCNNCKSDF